MKENCKYAPRLDFTARARRQATIATPVSGTAGGFSHAWRGKVLSAHLVCMRSSGRAHPGGRVLKEKERSAIRPIVAHFEMHKCRGDRGEVEGVQVPAGVDVGRPSSSRRSSPRMGMPEREYDLTLRTQGLTIPTLPDSESSTADRRRDGLFLLCAYGLFERGALAASPSSDDGVPTKRVRAIASI